MNIISLVLVVLAMSLFTAMDVALYCRSIWSMTPSERDLWFRKWWRLLPGSGFYLRFFYNK